MPNSLIYCSPPDMFLTFERGKEILEKFPEGERESLTFEIQLKSARIRYLLNQTPT